MDKPLDVIKGIKIAGGTQVPMEIVDLLIAELDKAKRDYGRMQSEMREIDAILVAGIPACIFGNFPKQTARFAVQAYAELKAQQPQPESESGL